MCIVWFSATQLLVCVVLVHMGVAMLHCLVLLLSPLWYRACTGVLYPVLLTAAAWVLPLLLFLPGTVLLNTTSPDPTSCAEALPIKTVVALHLPTFYLPALATLLIYTIVACIIYNKSQVTSQLQHEGVENAATVNQIQRDRWSSILSNHSSMATYNSETPSICSDNASVHSIPSIDIDDGSTVAISLPNGRNGFVHLNQAPPNGLFANLTTVVANGVVGNGEAPRRLVPNGSAVCLPDTISPATNEDEKKKTPPRDLVKQASSGDNDSMQLEIHKVDTDVGNDNTETETSMNDTQTNNTENKKETEKQDGPQPDEQNYQKEAVNRKLSAISERDDSSSLSIKSDDSSTPAYSPIPYNASEQNSGEVDDIEDLESLTTASTTSSETPGAKLTETFEIFDEVPEKEKVKEGDQADQENSTEALDDNMVTVTVSKDDDANTLLKDTEAARNTSSKAKSGKEQLNVPLDDADIDICMETDKLVAEDQGVDEHGIDNVGFISNDSECLSLSHSIQVKCKEVKKMDKDNENNGEDQAGKNDEGAKVNASAEGTTSEGHSRNSSLGGDIHGPRRSILRRDPSKRQSAKSVKFDIPDNYEEKPKEKRLQRKPTGKVPRNQQLKSKKGSKGSAKSSASSSKRRRTLVKQQAQTSDEPPAAAVVAPVSNGVISSSAPHAVRPPLISTSSASSTSSFGYMAAVQSSQAERLHCRVKAQQFNVNVLFVGFVIYTSLVAPHIVLGLVTSLCDSCVVSREVHAGLQWLMYSSSLVLPVVLLCFLPEYKSAIRARPGNK